MCPNQKLRSHCRPSFPSLPISNQLILFQYPPNLLFQFILPLMLGVIFFFFLSLFLSHLLIFTFSILDCSNFSSLFPISPAIVSICCFESDLHFYNDYIFLLFCTLVPSTHSYLFVVLSFIHSSLEA